MTHLEGNLVITSVKPRFPFNLGNTKLQVYACGTLFNWFASSLTSLLFLFYGCVTKVCVCAGGGDFVSSAVFCFRCKGFGGDLGDLLMKAKVKVVYCHSDGVLGYICLFVRVQWPLGSGILPRAPGNSCFPLG